MKPIQMTRQSAEEHSDNVSTKNDQNKGDEIKLKVFIADDSVEIRNRLKEMLKENKSITLAGEAEDAGQTITDINRLKPDVVILDVHMPGGGGMRVLRNIVLMETNMIAIVLTAFANAQYRQAYLAAGADYFFDKTNNVQTMVDTLDKLADQHVKKQNNESRRRKGSIAT